MTRILLSLIALLLTLGAAAQEAYDSQAEIRENPVFDLDAPFQEITAMPAYIDTSANHIRMNGDDWTALAQLIDHADSSRVAILHIGDSHFQADMASAVTRYRLADLYGAGGRGLVVPFRLAGTNEPTDYSIRSSDPMATSKLLKKPWAVTPGFTGISVSPSRESFAFEIVAREPFDSVAVFFTGPSLTFTGRSDDISPSRETERRMVTATSSPLRIAMGSFVNTACLHFTAPAGTAIHGFNLSRGDYGVSYHVIGNNGAAYTHYNSLPGFAEGAAALAPSLIVISLGTNEAFGRITDTEMRHQVTDLVASLRRAVPGAKFLLTTPQECQRRVSRRRGKGRRRRYTSSYQTNSNIRRLRDVILAVGRDEHIPVYDFYAVAGGEGSSARWLADRALGSDRIHLTRRGYTMMGTLFTDALDEAINRALPPE